MDFQNTVQKLIRSSLVRMRKGENNIYVLEVFLAERYSQRFVLEGPLFNVVSPGAKRPRGSFFGRRCRIHGCVRLTVLLNPRIMYDMLEMSNRADSLDGCTQRYICCPNTSLSLTYFRSSSEFCVFFFSLLFFFSLFKLCLNLF